jgi:glycosyltransferase involved in cell wall biosynthesis
MSPPGDRPDGPRPTLSVVMPNYNHARYLEPALGAHLAQTEPPLEIIVVDDGSTDESGAILERLARSNQTLRLMRLSENRGVNAAVNLGLREARGDYVCFSAADDLVGPDFAARSLEVLTSYPEAGFSFADLAVLVGDTGEIRRFPLYLSDGPCCLTPGDIERLLKRNYFTFASHSILYRRDALLAIGGFLEELGWLADWFATYVLAFRHGACYIPATLAYFRVSANSYSARGTRQAMAQRALVYRMVDILGTEALADVSGPFRASAVVPEYRLRLLGWLLASRRHRGYVSTKLVGRLLLRSTWTTVLPWVPVPLRRLMRRAASLPTRRRMAAASPARRASATTREPKSQVLRS